MPCFLSNEYFATLVSVFSVGSTRKHENTVEHKKIFHLMNIKEGRKTKHKMKKWRMRRRKTIEKIRNRWKTWNTGKRKGRNWTLCCGNSILAARRGMEGGTPPNRRHTKENLRETQKEKAVPPHYPVKFKSVQKTQNKS